MTQSLNCPNCGAQISVGKHGPGSVCSFCGSALGEVLPPEMKSDNPNELGYSPDPAPIYSAKQEPEPEEPKETKETIVIDGKPVEIPPDVIPNVLQTGRTISRYVILVIAAITLICALCLITGIFRK